MKRTHLSLAMGLTFGLFCVAPLSAQQQAAGETDTGATKPANAKQLGQVTVTARKREETLQDVPIAVSAFTAASLFKQNVQNLADLQGKVPSLQIYAARGSNTTLTAYIRGVGQADPTWGFDPGVGIYLDDVYLARPQGAVLDVFDVNRIEVLRGPQGTLYGKNTIGGAIKYVSNPLPVKSEGSVDVTVGTRGEKDVKASLGGASADHVWRARAAVASEHNDGFGKNQLTGSRNGNKNTNAARATLGFFPTSSFNAQLSVDGVRDNSNPRGAKMLIANKLDPAYAPLSSDFDTRGGMAQVNHTKLYGTALTLNWIASQDWSFKSVTALRGSSTLTNIDFDTLPQKIADVSAIYKDHQFSQELQANYDAGGSVHGVAGLYYFDGSATGQIHNIFLGSPPYSTLGLSQYGSTGGRMGTKSYAGYGDFTWDLSPAWSLDVGLRYTHETKTALIQNFGFSDATFSTRVSTVANFSGSHATNNVSPKVSLDWSANAQIKLYASYSEGFHSGGYNIRANCVAVPDSCRPIDDEKVQSFELGSKMTFLDDRLMMNTAAFHNVYSNIQLSVFSSYTLPNGSQGFFGDFTNAGKGHIDGLEEEFAWKPTEEWTFSGNFAYLHTKYTQYLTKGVNVADQQKFTNAPKWSGGLSLENTHALANGGSLTARVNYTYQSLVYPETTLSPLIAQPAYGLWNAGVIWQVSQPWTLSLQGTNLANKSYRTTGYNIGSLGIFTGFYGAPRMVTLSARYTF
ncbi:TonB-dependent receptor [Rhodanobacter glycinis]|uniref:TonB-dependent receptor n=1 Tax=Rhodanobacter glycinis TaxID=582702 RepID=A0A502C9H7_9GAMM|nr:TonB-dependent receptor [Rhodanobacter glycinis]TPG10245.1 TonB-dependent receptor [Rhodanobacter glycinis]TPG50843.1 TonB-dependent receptor [Rhodanobacter glycinis]